MKKLVVIGSVLLIVLLTLNLVVSCKKSGATNKTTSATSAITTSTQQTTTAATTGTTTTTTATDPLFIKHSLPGRPDCLSCHKPGAAAAIVLQAPSVPSDHSTYTNTDCIKSGCHYTK
jgi:nitrate reductase cytochrome c-type subunit